MKEKTKAFLILLCIIFILQFLTFYNNVNATTYTQTTKEGIDNFPEDYKSKLKILKDLYPNWKFTAYYTGITWEEFISAETSVHLRNTVIKSSDSLWKDSCGQVASGYACASTAIIKYFADPRNFLTESEIFQFLEMTYNEKTQTQEALENIISNTFMNKSITFDLDGETKTMTYSQIIMEAAKKSKMSPYSIAIKIIQEVGRNGSSSVSGYYTSSDGTLYEGYYNFFNYGAYDSGDAIANGLLYAKNNGWTNPYIAIIEGSKLMANSYTNAGQNTAYFYKWDVVGNTTSNLFWHQYMTNIQDPSSQAKSLFNTYVSNKLITSSLNFIIPIFEDMPSVNNLPTTINTSLKTSYYITGSDVRLRASATTSSSILATLEKNTVVTLLEWKVATANGYDWAKVKLSNDVEGYVANQYLKECNSNDTNTQNTNNQNTNTQNTNNQNTNSQNTNTQNTNNQNTNNQNTNTSNTNNQNTNIEIKSNNEKILKIDGEYIITIPGVKNSEFINALNLKSYKIYDSEGKEVDSKSSISTRWKLKVENKQYTITILGDVYSDGEIDARDYMKIKNHIMGTSTLNNFEMKTADVYGDKIIDARDYMKIKNHIMGTASITM